MKTGFKDRLAIKEPKKQKSPWDYKCPSYDERSSCFVNAGSEYGIGRNQPIGHSENPKNDNIIPKGRINTLHIGKTRIDDSELFDVE